jgi:hypothetical protein
VDFSLGGGDVAHGIVKRHPQHLDEEVDGVAGQVPFRPAPVGVFDEEAGKGGSLEVACLPFDELELAFLEQWNQGRLPGSTDLFTGPARAPIRRGGCHRTKED